MYENDEKTNLNPSICVNIRIPYDLYVLAKKQRLNISDAARNGVKIALGMMK